MSFVVSDSMRCSVSFVFVFMKVFDLTERMKANQLPVILLNLEQKRRKRSIILIE